MLDGNRRPARHGRHSNSSHKATPTPPLPAGRGSALVGFEPASAALLPGARPASGNPSPSRRTRINACSYICHRALALVVERV